MNKICKACNHAIKHHTTIHDPEGEPFGKSCMIEMGSFMGLGVSCSCDLKSGTRKETLDMMKH